MEHRFALLIFEYSYPTQIPITFLFLRRPNKSLLPKGESTDGLKDAGRIRKDADSDLAAKYLIAMRHGVVASVFQGLSRREAIRVWLNGLEFVLEGMPRGA